MEFSAVKSKSVIDASAGAGAAGARGKNSAQQLMGDFSAAVAARINASGQGMVGNRQNTLSSALSSPRPNQPEPRPEAQKTPPPERDDYQPRARAEAPDIRDDAPRAPEIKVDAPREKAPQDAPQAEIAEATRSDTAPDSGRKTSSDDQGSASVETDTQAQSGAEGDAGQAESGAEGGAEQAVVQAQAAVPVVAEGIRSLLSIVTAPTQPVASDKSASAAATPQILAATGGQDGEQIGDPSLNSGDAQKKSGDAQKKDSPASSQPTLVQKPNAGGGEDAAVKQQQAGDLATKIGADQKLNVTVNVTRQSEQLASQPSANLAAQAGEASAQTPTPTAKVASGPQTPLAHNLGNQSGGQGADAQQQNQPQQQQLAQAETLKISINAAAKSQAGQSAPPTAASASLKPGGGEALSNTTASAQTTQTQLNPQLQTPQKSAANPQAQARAQVTEQVNVQISKAIANGVDKISIQLKPAQLGRIDVQLELASDGRVSAVITADNKDTLDLLKQDSRELERAMREAGLNLGSGDLSFNLRENGGGSQDGTQTAGRGPDTAPLTNEPSLDELLQACGQRPDIISEDRIDITA